MRNYFSHFFPHWKRAWLKRLQPERPKNVQTPRSQGAQSLFSSWNLLPAHNHLHRVSLFSSLQHKKSICRWERRGFGPLSNSLTGVKQGLIKAPVLMSVFSRACICRSALRLQQEILLHSSDLHRPDRYQYSPGTGRQLAREIGSGRRKWSWWRSKEKMEVGRTDLKQ